MSKTNMNRVVLVFVINMDINMNDILYNKSNSSTQSKQKKFNYSTPTLTDVTIYNNNIQVTIDHNRGNNWIFKTIN